MTAQPVVNSTEETLPSPADEPPNPILADTSAAPLAIPPQLVENWRDWRWQMRHRIRSVAELVRHFPSLRSQTGLFEAEARFPIAVTPYYASLIRWADRRDPVFQMCIPQLQELYDPPFLKDDPLEEDEDMPVPRLVHRYPDRALLIATSVCATYCRHCTRKRVAGTRESTISAAELEEAAAYLAAHPEISDVIISGGDPLTMGTPAIQEILKTVRNVPSVQIIRIGTRVPVTMPQRITYELVRMLRRYHPIWVNTHFNHPVELTPEAGAACERLADAGIPVGNQTVLLRGINDNPETMEHLCRRLIRYRVRPYYLFQCDLVRGVEHFRTPLSRGIEIMEYLRGRLSGLAIPTFVVDAPHGGGKIPILPNYVVSSSPTHTVLRNFEGMLVSYPEPGINRAAHRSSHRHPTPGVWDLASGHASAITPAHTARHHRRRELKPDPLVREPAAL
jgi:lysine 2,3-aminomutase